MTQANLEKNTKDIITRRLGVMGIRTSHTMCNFKKMVKAVSRGEEGWGVDTSPAPRLQTKHLHDCQEGKDMPPECIWSIHAI